MYILGHRNIIEDEDIPLERVSTEEMKKLEKSVEVWKKNP